VNPLVVKIGGSLFDWPQLGPTLARWLREHAPRETLLVPGGGPFAEPVRRLAETHRLDDETSHWLALRSMTLSAAFLRTLLGQNEWTILDALAFCRADDRQPGALPHNWSVTSDSVAARAAEVRSAELVLLKSADAPPGNIAAWAAAGYVDAYFPTIVERTKLTVRAINLRAV
jgi:5-(aminomethyl)-3-furanmethanol phosphate kinase